MENNSSVKSNTILCCNIRDLVDAKQEEDYFVLQNGKMKGTSASFNQIIIVGKIMSSNEGPSRHEYQVDDHSGCQIEVQYYLNTDASDDSNMPNRSSEDERLIESGTYVSIVGHLRVFGNSRNIVAFNVRPLKSYNELTTHSLRVLHNYLLITKDQSTNSHTSSANIVGHMQSNSTSAYNQRQFSNIDSGFSDQQRQVHNTIRRLQNQNGCSLKVIAKELGNLSTKKIEEAIEFLSNEGHIYSTIDDDHFMTTD
ncbi:MAG: DNA-directed RNA polymerase I subunit rpa2 [Marteilia pararefringens]